MVTVLTGTNFFARRAALREIENDFTKKYGSVGIEHMQQVEQLTPEALMTACLGVSLFAEHRLLIIRDISSNKQLTETFVEILEKLTQEVEVVLVETQLDKRSSFYKTLTKTKTATILSFEPLSEPELVRWVTRSVTDEGGTISGSDAKLLVESVGTDQARLMNEVQKLLAFDPHITKESIETLVEKTPQSSVFYLLEQLIGGKHSNALKSLGALKSAHEDPFMIANMLVWQAQVLAVVSSADKHETNASIAKAARLNPFVVQKTRSAATHISAAQLSRIVNRVAELDMQLKTTSIDPWDALTQVVLEL